MMTVWKIRKRILMSNQNIIDELGQTKYYEYDILTGVRKD